MIDPIVLWRSFTGFSGALAACSLIERFHFWRETYHDAIEGRSYVAPIASEVGNSVARLVGAYHFIVSPIYFVIPNGFQICVDFIFAFVFSTMFVTYFSSLFWRDDFEVVKRATESSLVLKKAELQNRVDASEIDQLVKVESDMSAFEGIRAFTNIMILYRRAKNGRLSASFEHYLTPQMKAMILTNRLGLDVLSDRYYNAVISIRLSGRLILLATTLTFFVSLIEIDIIYRNLKIDFDWHSLFDANGGAK